MPKIPKNLLIISLIAVVNALGYGIIIPVLYSYSQKFGLTDFQNGLLFATYSICQFIATPVIGRLSDKYGRRPLLIVSLAGTALSFFMMAFAQSALVLFIARALDGITSGNIPVATAVISDTTTSKERARGFGIIGASFGFGIIFGPAISAFTIGINPALPFIFAGIITVIAVLLTTFFLPETNKNIGTVTQKGPVIDIVKIIKAVTDKTVGLTLLLTLIYSFAFSLFIYAWQPAAIKVFHLSVQQLSFAFAFFGVIGLISQLAIMPRCVAVLGDKRSLIFAFVGLMVAFFVFYFINSFQQLLMTSILIGFANSFITPLIQTLLSKATDEQSQGSILGLYQSYFSIGQIVGPIIGGLVAMYSVTTPFLVGSLVCLGCIFLAYKINTHHKIHAF